MRVTSFKDLESYIYSTLVMPLKELAVPYLEISSPLTGRDGQSWRLSLRDEPTRGRYRRNYQRTQAQRQANSQFLLETGTSGILVIGTYFTRTHAVTLYEAPFRHLNAMPLLGKLHEAFLTNTPFSKVMVDSAVRPLQREHDSLDAYDTHSLYDHRNGETVPSPGRNSFAPVYMQDDDEPERDDAEYGF